MKALVLSEIDQPLQLLERPAPQPETGEVIVSLKAVALNRRDYWITQGMYPGIQLPVILGSDGAGIVTNVADGVDQSWIGREVIINPGLNWGDNPRVQSDEFQILGMPGDGTFAEQVAVPVEQLHERPAHLSWAEAAALPLAGSTAYRAVFSQGHLEPGQHLLVTGIGGGVATFALQFARVSGAKITVTSSSAGKINFAQKLGATAGYNYREERWEQPLLEAHGLPDLIIDSAGGSGYATLLRLAAPGGRIVSYGATTGPPADLDLFKVFWKQLRLIGTTMGSPEDFAAMLELVNSHQIKPAIDRIFPLAEANSAFDAMRASSQFGKLVLEIDPEE